MAVIKFIQKYKSSLLKGGLSVVSIGLFHILYDLSLSSIPITFGNYPIYQTTNLILDNKDSFVQMDNINLTDLGKADNKETITNNYIKCIQ